MSGTHTCDSHQSKDAEKTFRIVRCVRRKNPSDPPNVALFLTKEVSAGRTQGYKLHHLWCIPHGYCISQETVRPTLRVIDPVRVELRRRRYLRRCLYSNHGPNFLWHMDGYDQLKSYGLCIHGAIDVFSRWCHEVCLTMMRNKAM